MTETPNLPSSDPHPPARSESRHSEELSAWLLRERQIRSWARSEMARRIIRAGREVGDTAMPGLDSMCHNIYRWERGTDNPSERYRLYYCRAFGIKPSQFGSDVRGNIADIPAGAESETGAGGSRSKSNRQKSYWETRPVGSPNLVLREIREKEREETRAEFAEAMRRKAIELGENVAPTERAIARLESGEVRYPHRPTRRVLTALCGRSMQELGFTRSAIKHAAEADSTRADPAGADVDSRHPASEFPDYSEPAQSSAAVRECGAPDLSQSNTHPDPFRSSFASEMSEMAEAVRRREFLLGMTAAVSFATEMMVPNFQHVDPELIPYFKQQLEGHYRADMLLGPRALISTVTAQCKLISQLIDSADEPTRQRMAVVGTSFASFAAWLHLDAGDVAASLHWHDMAQEMAHRSRDREAIACALVDRAMARTDQGMGTAVVDLCDSALMDGRHLSPEIHVFALQQKAHGASIIGDRHQVDALLDTAGRFVDQVDVEVWGVPCLRTPNYVEVHRATCYGRLGLAKEALEIWQQIIPVAPSTARRDVGVWVARQAASAASLREPEWTVELARQAVKVALETGSARVRRELAAVKVTMAPWQAEPVGQNFAEVLAPIGEGILS